MIISIAIRFNYGQRIWTCCEDFESAEEGVLYARARLRDCGLDIRKVDNVAVAPLRATGLEMAGEIQRILVRGIR